MAITLDNLRKTVKKNKGKSQALAWLADMERASGDYEAALKIIDEALAASPSDVPAMLVRARILAGQQDFAGSVSEYKKVLAKDPFCLSAHKRMGEAYDQLGKTTERNMCFRRVHDMDPLDSFWKEEYDVLPEEQESDLAAPPMDDDSFTMNMDSESGNAEGEDNIFANLASSMPNSEEDDNASMDDLMKSLNSAADGSVDDGNAQDQSYEGSDVLSTSEVSSAITGFLGGDDDLDTSENQASNAGVNASPFSAANVAAVNIAPKSDDNLFSLDANSESESKPTNVDDAFSSIFGDDDLPEEKPAGTSESLSDWSPSATSAATEESLETPKEEDKATNVDDAFSSIFGDDDLPEEKSLDALENSAIASNETVAESQKEPEEEDSFGGLFEKSADADFSLDEKPTESASEISNKVSEENSIPSSHMDFSDDEVESLETPKEEDKATNVDDAFSSIFGDDDVFEEKPAEETLTEKPIEQTAESSSDPVEEQPASEEDSFGGLFEKSADADFSLDKKEVDAAVEAPAVEATAPTEPKANEPESAKTEELSAGVDGAFDALFDNEKNDETPIEDAFAEVTSAEQSQTEPLPVEDFSLNSDNLELPTESKDAPKEENLADEMGGAFASMFGNEDDLSLPDEKSDALADSTSETNVAEAPLSQEATSAAIEEDSVKDSVDGSFDSLFGDDDDLPEEKTESAPSEKIALTSATDMVVEQAESAEPVVEPEKTTETFAKAPSAELDSIDSEVSNAFKGLFDEDDSLAESDEPSNKGVDYLMSGDSDDEVAASLVNNADAPLSRGAADLDDSLNTRTLADIYMEQGVYNKALDIYADLVKKNPDNEEIKSRYDEIEKLCQEKFGEA